MRLPCLLSMVGAASAYCSAGNTLDGDSNLGKVELVGSGGSISDTSNCPGVVGLIDLTNLKAPLQPGGTYVLTATATTCDAGWARLVYAYADFDGNGVYDPGELIGQESVGNTVAPTEVNFEFSPPCLGEGSEVGSAQIRVFVQESGFTPNPCQVFSYGAVKEFSIEMLADPGAKCGGTDNGGGGGGDGLGGGGLFLILFAVFIVVYVVVGLIITLKVKPEMAGHMVFAPLTKEFWVHFMGLVKAGCMFTKDKLQSLSGGKTSTEDYSNI